MSLLTTRDEECDLNYPHHLEVLEHIVKDSSFQPWTYLLFKVQKASWHLLFCFFLEERSAHIVYCGYSGSWKGLPRV